jgi:hypothetical protein
VQRAVYRLANEWYEWGMKQARTGPRCAIYMRFTRDIGDNGDAVVGRSAMGCKRRAARPTRSAHQPKTNKTKGPSSIWGLGTREEQVKSGARPLRSSPPAEQADKSKRGFAPACGAGKGVVRRGGGGGGGASNEPTPGG